MAIYLLAFAASTGIFAYAQNKNKRTFYLLSALGLLIPCLIAALRATTVGTDVQVYLEPMVDSVISAPSYKDFFSDFWFDKWRNLFVADYELGFSTLVFVVARITKSLPAVMFAVQAFTIVPFFAALARNRKTMPVWLGMLVFFFFSYNTSLNLMRQWIAVGFLLLAFQMLLEKRPVGLTVCSVAALLFHYSAIIMVLIYAIFFYIYLHRNIKLQIRQYQISGSTIAVATLTLVAILLLLNLNLLLKLFGAIGFDRFSNYLEGNQLSFLPMQILLRLPMIAIFLFNWKYFRKRGVAAAFYLAMMFLEVIAAQLISVDTYSFRVGSYFSIYTTLAVPTLLATIEDKKRRQLTTVCLVGYMLVYWYYTFVMQLRHETVPYQFFFEV